jgi:hypothetical protein
LGLPGTFARLSEPSWIAVDTAPRRWRDARADTDAASTATNLLKEALRTP